jgi:hemoglobin
MTFKPLPLCQAIDREQVAAVVHEFYIRVLADETLAPHFAGIRDWPRHEGYITDFWWGVMGGAVAEPRPGAMIKGHQGLAITDTLMQRWLLLFGETIDEQIPAAEAVQWQTIARGIATMMGEHGLVEKEA